MTCFYLLSVSKIFPRFKFPEYNSFLTETLIHLFQDVILKIVLKLHFFEKKNHLITTIH